MYLATFDTEGNRITSYVVGMHKDIPSDAIAISDEDQALYVTNEYIRGVDGTPVKRPAYVPTLLENKTKKLAELDQAAASAYVSGFYSSASGQRLYYDSEEADQSLINGVYARTKETDWETKVRYPGVAPAGQAPIRARPTADSPATDKNIQFLNAAGLKTLVDDMDSHLYTVKATHWQLQAAVVAATTVEEVKAISWPE